MTTGLVAIPRVDVLGVGVSAVNMPMAVAELDMGSVFSPLKL